MDQLKPTMIGISARCLGIQGPVRLGNGALSCAWQSQTQHEAGESLKVNKTDGAEPQKYLGMILSLVPFVLQLSTPWSNTMAVYYELDTDSGGHMQKARN